MFSEKVKELRKQRGLSQEDFAKAIGVARSTVSMWELGEREPNFETAEMLADFFNVRLDTLISKAQIDDYLYQFKKENLKQAIFGTTKISDEKLEEVMAYARFVKNREDFDAE